MKFNSMKLRYKVGVGIVAGATVLGMGVAYAQWTASGSGSGTAKAGTAQGVSAAIVTYSGSTGLLYPGVAGTGQLQVSLTNPNTYPVKVTSVSEVSDATHWVTSDVASNGCTDDPSTESSAGDVSTLAHPTGVSFATQTKDASSADMTLTAGQTKTFTLSGVSMNGTSDNNCQGATFTIPLATSAISTAS